MNISIISSVPLPIVSNVEKKITNIDNESLFNMKSLNNIINNNIEEDLEDKLINSQRFNKGRLSVKQNTKLSILSKPKLSIAKPMIMTQRNVFHYQKKDISSMSTSKVIRKTKQFTLQPKEEEVEYYTTQSRSRHNATDLIGWTHRKTISSLEIRKFKRLIDNQCLALYQNYNTFVSSIQTTPKLSMEINLKTSKERNAEFLHKILIDKNKGKSKRKAQIVEHSKVIRESNVVSKINSSMGFNSMNILKKILTKTPEPIDYSFTNAINEYTLKRLQMKDKANSIMRKSEYKTRQCLKTMYEFKSKV